MKKLIDASTSQGDRLNMMEDNFKAMENHFTTVFQDFSVQMQLIGAKLEQNARNPRYDDQDHDDHEHNGYRNRNGGHNNNWNTRMKLEMPRFDGFEPQDWVFKVERFMRFNGVHEEEKVELVSFHLDGSALQWYHKLSRNNRDLSWRFFVQALMRRFGPSEFEDPQALLAKLRQQTTVECYWQQFDKLSN